MIEDSREYTIREAAAFLGRSPNTVQAWVNQCEIEHHLGGPNGMNWRIYGSDIRECAESKGIELKEDATPQPKTKYHLDEAYVNEDGHFCAVFNGEPYEIWPKKPKYREYMRGGKEYGFIGNVEFKFHCLPKMIRSKDHMVLLRHNQVFRDWYGNVIQDVLKKVYRGLTEDSLATLRRDYYCLKKFNHWSYSGRGLTTEIGLGCIEGNFGNKEDAVGSFIAELKEAMAESKLFNMYDKDFPSWKQEQKD